MPKQLGLDFRTRPRQENLPDVTKRALRRTHEAMLEHERRRERLRQKEIREASSDGSR